MARVELTPEQRGAVYAAGNVLVRAGAGSGKTEVLAQRFVASQARIKGEELRKGRVAEQRLHGPYSHFYYALILCNILTPQLLWFEKVRRNVAALFLMSLVVNTGMWLERFVIVVISLTRDFMPSAWGRYSPTFWDYSTFIGTIGLFVMLIFLFVRVLPAIAIAEMRELVAEQRPSDEENS